MASTSIFTKKDWKSVFTPELKGKVVEALRLHTGAIIQTAYEDIQTVTPEVIRDLPSDDFCYCVAGPNKRPLFIPRVNGIVAFEDYEEINHMALSVDGSRKRRCRDECGQLRVVVMKYSHLINTAISQVPGLRDRLRRHVYKLETFTMCPKCRVMKGLGKPIEGEHNFLARLLC